MTKQIIVFQKYIRIRYSRQQRKGGSILNRNDSETLLEVTVATKGNVTQIKILIIIIRTFLLLYIRPKYCLHPEIAFLKLPNKTVPI